MTDGSQTDTVPAWRRDPTSPCPSPAGRRVPTPPPGFSLAGRRVSAPPCKRGVTLVELMISMLILAIVCISWLQIIGIQSARKEARRREAVERLAGMMDAFMYEYSQSSPAKGVYFMEEQENGDNGFSKIRFKKVDMKDKVTPMFDGGISPVGYQLCVVEKSSKLPNAEKFENENSKWGSGRWLVGKLYNRSDCLEADAGKPFFTLPVCMGSQE